MRSSSWSGPWLDPAFRRWDITEELAYIRVPILIVQGEDDQYGTLRQIEMAQEECICPVEAVILPGDPAHPASRGRRRPPCGLLSISRGRLQI